MTEKTLFLMPKKWQDFQHYKDRCPPWIKLHRDLLNNKDFMRLPTASKALAPMFWLLASESKLDNGAFDASDDELAFRLRMSVKEIQIGRKSLIDNGFFSVASGMLADCYQVATPEESRGERETEKETDISPAAPNGAELLFEEFWKTYPKKVGKDAAKKAFAKRKPTRELLAQMVQSIREQVSSDAWKKEGGQFIPHPSTWINEGRWQDESVVHVSLNAGTDAAEATRRALDERDKGVVAMPSDIRAKLAQLTNRMTA